LSRNFVAGLRSQSLIRLLPDYIKTQLRRSG